MPFNAFTNFINAFDSNTFQVKEGRVLVIGSNDPWIEVILLEKGAKHVTTLEYMVVENSHPNITAVTPDIIREMYLDKKFQNDDQRFDAMVTFSSLEHSGLGRYKCIFFIFG